MTRKEELQEQLKELGVLFLENHSIPELQELLKRAKSSPIKEDPMKGVGSTYTATEICQLAILLGCVVYERDSKGANLLNIRTRVEQLDIQIVSVGKFKGLQMTYLDILKTDPGYTEWLLKQRGLQNPEMKMLQAYAHMRMKGALNKQILSEL